MATTASIVALLLFVSIVVTVFLSYIIFGANSTSTNTTSQTTATGLFVMSFVLLGLSGYQIWTMKDQLYTTNSAPEKAPK